MNRPRPVDTALPTEPADDPVVLRTERLTRCFGAGPGTIVAVRGVTTTVAPRARIAVTGPSGSGKSTLLHLLAGLDTPTSGTICWPPADPVEGDRAASVGLVFQGRSLVPNLNVLENVRLPLLFAGHTESEATVRARDALDRLNLDALADALPDTLSGGQAQRIAIARVLATAPRLILADEPTGQLDHATATVVIDVLLRAADDLGSALIVSTHDPLIARRLPTEWAMRDGRLRITTRTADGPCR